MTDRTRKRATNKLAAERYSVGVSLGQMIRLGRISRLGKMSRLDRITAHDSQSPPPLQGGVRGGLQSSSEPNHFESNAISPKAPRAALKIRTIYSIVSLLLLATIPSACQQPQRVPQFPARGFTRVWPPAPDTPRIRFVGEIVGEASFGRAGRIKSLGEIFTGPAPALRFTTPMAVAVNGERAIVADAQAGAVFICDLLRRAVTAVREAAGEPFAWPIDVVALDSGFAVCDSRRAAVFMFDANGTFQRAFGKGNLQRPCALTWNAAANELWVLDAGAHACVVFDANGRQLRKVGGRGVDPGKFNFPAGIGWRRGTGIAVADSMNFRVQLIDNSGSADTVFGKKGDAAGDFAMPRDVAVDSDGNIYVLDNQFENVQIFNRAGQLLMAFGGEGQRPGEFYLPAGITIDERDRIWIADAYNRRVQVFQYLSQRDVTKVNNETNAAE